MPATTERCLAIHEISVGMLVFTGADLFTKGAQEWLKSPVFEIDTSAIVLKDAETGQLGYVYLTDHLESDAVNAKKARFWNITDKTVLYATQQDAIVAAIAHERAWAEGLLAACQKMEQHFRG